MSSIYLWNAKLSSDPNTQLPRFCDLSVPQDNSQGKNKLDQNQSAICWHYLHTHLHTPCMHPRHLSKNLGEALFPHLPIWTRASHGMVSPE